MVLPTINFNSVNKVMFANSEISKVFCGSELVWENTKKETLYVKEQTKQYQSILTLENVQAREIKEIISLEIVGYGTIGKDKIKGYHLYFWGELEVSFVDKLSSFGITGTVFENTEVIMTYN